MREQRSADMRAAGVIGALDGIRGYSALAVVVFHCFLGAGAPLLGWDFARFVVAGLYLGVDVFFVLSGFVLFLPIVRAGGRVPDLVAFLVRRAARILPAYVIALVATALAVPWLDDALVLRGHDPAFLAVVFLAHLVFLQDLLFVRAIGFGISGQLWSLPIEASFYAALPWLGPVYWRRPALALVVAFGMGLVWRELCWSLPALIAFAGYDAPAAQLYHLGWRVVLQLPTFLPHFAAGMGAAWLYRRPAGSSLVRRAPAIQLVSLIALVASLHEAGRHQLLGTGQQYFNVTQNLHVAALSGALIWSTASASSRVTAFLDGRLSRWLGKISYPMYLYHLIPVRAAMRLAGSPQPPGSGWAFLEILFVSLPIVCLLAWLSDTFLERPIREWGRRWSSQRGSLQGEPALGD